jgi:peroxiredoxin
MFLRKRDRSPRQRLLILILEVLVFVALYLGLRAWLQRDMADGPVPAFQARDLAGELFAPEHYRGKPLLLHFWASWCRVCALERGVITAIDQDWPVVTIAMQSGNTAEVQAFMNQHDLKWRTLPDETGSLASLFGVSGVPASFVLDESGRIVSRETGYTTSAGLRFRLWLAERF